MTMTVVETTSTNIAITSTGLRFTDATTIDEWTSIGERLEQHDRNLRWIIGDWLVYGSERFGARAAVVADALNLSTGAVANAASVCRRVPHDRRRPELSFSHHEEVAHLDEVGQRRMLDTAAREGLSKSVLRQLVQEEERERRAVDTTSSPANGSTSTTASSSSSDSAVKPGPVPAAQHGPITVTVLLDGELPDRQVIDDGLERIREGLSVWFRSHGYDTTVEFR